MRHYFMYDPQNGLYMGWGVANPDPEGEYALPYAATWEMPQICNPNQVVILRGGQWCLINRTLNNRPVSFRERAALAWKTLFWREFAE